MDDRSLWHCDFTLYCFATVTFFRFLGTEPSNKISEVVSSTPKVPCVGRSSLNEDQGFHILHILLISDKYTHDTKQTYLIKYN